MNAGVLKSGQETGEREGEWHAAKGHRWNWTRVRCSEDTASAYGATALLTEPPDAPHQDKFPVCEKLLGNQSHDSDGNLKIVVEITCHKNKDVWISFDGGGRKDSRRDWVHSDIVLRSPPTKRGSQHGRHILSPPLSCLPPSVFNLIKHSCCLSNETLQVQCLLFQTDSSQHLNIQCITIKYESTLKVNAHFNL